MPLLILLRWLRGCVHFSAEGGFPERFLNICRRAGIELWNTELRSGAVYAFVRASDFRALRNPARQSGMRLRVCKKKGLPFFLHKQKKHAGLAVGVCLFALLLGIFSTRIWTINVDGNDLTESRILLEKLEENGVLKGMQRRNLDARNVSKEMLDALPQLDWIALNVRGSELEVLIREHPPDIRGEEPDAQADVVASYDGRLIDFRVYAGTKAVPDGSAIRKGDVLIHGHTNNVDETTSPIRAKGYIVAETRHTLTQRQAFESAGAKRDKLRKQYAVHVFGLRLPLYLRAWDDTWQSVQFFSANDVTLPLGLETRSLPVKSLERMPLSLQQAEILALERLHFQAGALLEYKELRSVSAGREDDSGAVMLTAKYVLWESVGLTKEK